jgi:hypothetical protein
MSACEQRSRALATVIVLYDEHHNSIRYIRV